MSILGIDTSCYTTSLAVVQQGKLLAEERRVLEVQKGQRGLRQSDALFQHIKNFPVLYEALSKKTDLSLVEAVTVSVKPRRSEGSYMPVFMAGASFAKTVAATLGVPLFETTHQEGHLMAGVCSEEAWELLKKPFTAVHASGGTTEILSVKPDECGFSEKIVGGSKDLHAGQLVDRVGVSLGLGFPAGASLEKMAVKGKVKLPVNLKGSWFHLSGLENKAAQLLSEGKPKEEIAYALFEAVGRSMAEAVLTLPEEERQEDILWVGGVMANGVIRETLHKYLSEYRLHFAAPRFSTDNAFGVAAIGEMRNRI